MSAAAASAATTPSAPPPDIWERLGSWAASEFFGPALVALIFSAVWILVLEGHRARRDRLTARVDGLREDLMTLWERTASYWSRDADPRLDAIDSEWILLLEQDTRWRVSRVAQELGIDDQLAADHVADISHAATGGDFGDPGRKSDPQRVAQLRYAVIMLRNLLGEARDTRLRNPFRIGG